MFVNKIKSTKLNVKTEKLLAVLPKSRNKNPIRTADLIVNDNQFTIPPFGVKDYSHGVNWDGGESRSYLRLLHALTPLGCLTEAYELTGELIYITKGLDFISNWDSNNQYSKQKNSMAFHDETTALRLQYILRFYLVCNANFTLSDKKIVENIMEFTTKLLSEDDFHSTNTNHGMFQDIALLQYSYYKDDEEKKELALNRLLNYFNHVYTNEGVHKEHSPAYHLVVSNNLKKIIEFIKDIDLNLSIKLNQIYVKTEEFATFVLKPDSSLPPLGDTERKFIKDTGFKELYKGENFLFSSTTGKVGSPPRETVKVFKESGYAIFRNDWLKKEKSTYVLFNAAYHVDYHKHSDDLSLCIYSNGDLITEAGPNGYNYSDPLTQYGYSSFAHNTLIVDGKGLVRTDGQYDKVFIEDYIITENYSEVTGVNQRFENVVHKRNVLFNEHEELIRVQDKVFSEHNHNYKLLWHVADGVKAHVRDNFVELFRGDNKVAEIEFVAKVPFKVNQFSGQKEPSVKGWMFSKMEHGVPSTVLEVDFEGENCTFETLFRLSNFKIATLTSPFNLESQFSSLKNIRYHFQEAKNHKLKDELIIVFSSLAEKYKFRYNYIRTLENIHCNKLYILDDFGDQGAYYLGKNRDFSIETTVNSLIQYFQRKLKIQNEKITMVGSSKGGYAAIYFGIKNYVGNVITGAPQSNLGHFLLNQAQHPNIAEYIAGGTEKSDQIYLDQLLYTILQQPSDVSPEIKIMVGSKDHHLKNHVEPLVASLKEKKFDITLKIEQGIDHEGLKSHFPKYLLENIMNILEIDFKIPEIADTSITHLNSTLKVTCNASGDKLSYAFYIYRNNEVIEKIMYGPSDTVLYSLSQPGVYQARVFVRDQFGNKVTKYTEELSI
jgi:Heparinase II/III-like protein/Heparinase II/III N-terminus